MGLERQKYIDKIIGLLAILKAKIELSNPLNLTDINIHSENFYRDFLNLLYGFKLENINIIDPNTAAIDLGDHEKKYAFQVTSTSDLSKTRKTVNSFINKKLYEKYDRLIIINITKKSAHRDNFVGDDGVYQFDTKEDLWDIGDLVKDINDLILDKIKEVCKFLQEQIYFDKDTTLAKEIETFMSLIGYLSDENQLSAGSGFIEAPDPDGKINKRFVDYSAFLIKEYQDLYTEYGKVLEDVMIQAGIGQTRIRRLGLHLKNNSDNVLNLHDGDAKAALEALVESYKETLSKNYIEYDESAIRFFLVDQLIKCNVFPNKEQ